MSNQGNRLQQAPFIRILIYFITGIVLAEWLLPPKNPFYILIPVFLLFCILFWRKSSRQDISGLLILLTFVSLGFSLAVYRRYDPKAIPTGEYLGVLDEYPLEKGDSYRAAVRLRGSEIKILAYFDKLPDPGHVKPGTLLFFKGEPQLIKNSGNPYEFDYQSYARRNRIGHRIYLKQKDYCILSAGNEWNLRYRALILRENLLQRLQKTGIKGETFRVISAITLGARNNLDPETTRSFTRTGTLHVLAVSGGNVAVVYVFLYLFFGFLNKRETLWIFTFLILLGIWTYTLITGLSPSVLRAAVMFSFVIVGKGIRRNPDIYNILASSAFILLFMKPSLLYDVGFQLSYAAIFAIVFLQPVFFKLFCSKCWVIDKLWIFFTVSLAAQIGTLPFSLWYFHQFPVYFWLSNIIVVPLVSLFLYLAFLAILTAPLLPVIAIFTSQILMITGSMMLKFLHFVEYLPFAVIENIYPTAGQLSSAVLCVTLAILLFIYKKSYYLIGGLSSLTIFLFLITVDLWHIQTRNEIVIFNAGGKILAAFTHRNETIWITDTNEKDSVKLNYLTKPYEGYRRIMKTERYFIGFPSQKRTDIVSIRYPFLNFNGINIYFQDNRAHSIAQKDFPPVDFIFVSNVYKKSAYSIYTEKYLVTKNSSGILFTKKNSPPEIITSGEEKALQINIDQKPLTKEISK